MALNIELLVYSLMWIFILSTYDNANGQYYPYPTYSEEFLPETGFSCSDKVNGAYYADIETDCQMYHICSKDKFGIMRSTKFLCGNGTVFDQRHLVCQDYRRVLNCQNSEKFYRLPRTKYEKLDFERQQIREERKNLIMSYENAFREGLYPTYSELDLPETGFTCEGKMNGGHYADIETGCQMYHVCSKDKDGVMRSTRFLCVNGTVFDQRNLGCQDYRKVFNCHESEKFYRYPSRIWDDMVARIRGII